MEHDERKALIEQEMRDLENQNPILKLFGLQREAINLLMERVTDLEDDVKKLKFG